MQQSHCNHPNCRNRSCTKTIFKRAQFQCSERRKQKITRSERRLPSKQNHKPSAGISKEFLEGQQEYSSPMELKWLRGKKKTHERFYRRSRTQKKQGASPYNSSNWVRPCEQQQIGQMQNTTRHTDRWTATGDKKVQSNISNFGPWRSGELEIQIWKRNDRHSRQKTVFQGIIKARNSSKTTINRNTNLNHKYCSVLSKDKSTHARRNKRSNRLRRVTSRWQWRK